MLGRSRVTSAIVGAVMVGLLWAAVPAHAAQRYASPNGVGTSCTALDPCSIQIAAQASPGDEVILEPGNYSATTEIAVPANGSMHGRAGAPRPRLTTSAPFGIDVRPGATLSDLELHHTGANVALYMGGTTDRVFVRSTSDACGLTRNGATILNSVCFTTGSESFAVSSAVGATAQLPLETGTLRNVTAFAQNGYGIVVDAGDYAELVIRATNVSAFGVLDDVMTREGGTQGIVSATVILDHSLFQYVNTDGGGLITPPGSPTNLALAGSQYLEDVLANDFHQTPGAPTIDAGTTSPANGPLDLDGRPRAQGRSTDIGAYEVPVAGSGSGGGGPGTASGGVSADKTNPVASKLDVQPGAFAALSGRGSSLISAKRKPAKGATVKYRLSEAATITFTVERAVRGRKKKSRCVPGRRKGRACTTYKKVKGSFTHAGKAGANSLRFSGRLARKPLRPGSYRLVGTARDAAGNKSKAVRTGFRIVRG